jgi:hypothetical protein
VWACKRYGDFAASTISNGELLTEKQRETVELYYNETCRWPKSPPTAESHARVCAIPSNARNIKLLEYEQLLGLAGALFRNPQNAHRNYGAAQTISRMNDRLYGSKDICLSGRAHRRPGPPAGRITDSQGEIYGF